MAPPPVLETRVRECEEIMGRERLGSQCDAKHRCDACFAYLGMSSLNCVVGVSGVYRDLAM